MLKEIELIILFLDEFHLIMAVLHLDNAEVPSSKVVPSSFTIKVVELSPKLLNWGPVEFNIWNGIT